MNKKAITSEAVYAILILIAIVIIASIFMVPIISKWIKPPIAFVEEKLGLMTPTGTTLNQMQDYVNTLISDDINKSIDGSVWSIQIINGNYPSIGKDQYAKFSVKEKIEGYYNWAKDRIISDQNKPGISDDDWTSLNDMKTKLEFAHNYAYYRYVFYTNLPQPKASTTDKGVLVEAETTAAELTATKNCEVLKTLKSKLASMNIPPDFTDITTKVNALKTALGDIDKETSEDIDYCCSVGSTICESKLKFLCRWGNEVNNLNLISNTKCVRDVCDKVPDANACDSNPKCYVKWYTANWKDSVGGRFDRCMDCRNVNCPDNNHKTCLDAIKKCDKCAVMYDSAGIFNACVAKP